MFLYLFVFILYGQDQSSERGDDSNQRQEKNEEKKQNENTAFAKKVVFRLAGLMGVGAAVGVVYIFGEWLYE